jgi:hypothetical protein
VKDQPLKFIRYHKTLSLIPWRVDPVTGCWIWLRHISNQGYSNRGAYRTIYRQYKGEIPAGLHLDHLCRNRKCVNPDHLEPVTPKTNSRRALSTKLTANEVVEIRKLRSEGATLKEIAVQYGISVQNVCSITHRRSWKEI